MARVHLFSSATAPHNDKRQRLSASPPKEEIYGRISEYSQPPTPAVLDEGHTLDVTAVPTSTSSPLSMQQPSPHGSPQPTHAATSSSNLSSNTGGNETTTAPSSTLNLSQFGSSSAALTAALLQSTHSNLDVADAVAAALSLKPETLQTLKEKSQHSTPQQATQQHQESPATHLSSDAGYNDTGSSSPTLRKHTAGDGKPVLIDSAAAATALQLLELSHSDVKAKPYNEGAEGQSTQGSMSSNASANSNDQLNNDNVMLIANYPGLTQAATVEALELQNEEIMQDYKRGTWTQEEDELLLAGIKKYGYGRWKDIANTIPGRKGKQLKQRWDNTLASKYVDREWLQNKIRNDEELQNQQHHHHLPHQQNNDIQDATSFSAASTPRPVDTNKDDLEDKTMKLFESMNWNDIAQKIAEKVRDRDQEATEALLSQLLLGTVGHTVSNSTSTPTTATPTAAATAPSSPALASDASPLATPTTEQSISLPTVNSGANANTAPTLNFADAAAVALYAQQLSQHSTPSSERDNPLSSSSLVALANHPYFLSNPFGHAGNDNAVAVAAAAAVAAVAQAGGAVPGLSSGSNYSTPSSPASRNATAGHKRRRSDPALAETQSAAMSIYASSAPITTTINNSTQTVYPCLFPNCGKTFQRLYNLKSHSRTHTDDRPFTCHVCQTAFSRNHDLKRHVKIHGGDKPYKCLGCDKTFSRLDALKRHKSNQRNKTACMNP